MKGDGDGWVECGLGHRHWGKNGAAGLLVYTATNGQARVLLQHRAAWCHHGDTWGIPGGARDSHETGPVAALREAHEEAGVRAANVVVHRELIDDHGGWAYTTVVASAREPFSTIANEETLELRWQLLDRTDQLALHPGFANTWPEIRATSRHVLVDTANVVGTTPNGWWRDRAGASSRLMTSLDDLPTRVVTGPDASSDVVIAAITFVLEGQARQSEPAREGPGQLGIVRANGSGDDALVEHVLAHPSQPWLVVTADRGLRQRLPSKVAIAGPKWLLGLTEDAETAQQAPRH